MRPPLWWIWVSTFTRLVVRGEPYWYQPRGQVRKSAWIAGVITQTCRDVRRDGRRSRQKEAAA